MSKLQGQPLENGWIRWKTTGSNFDLPPQYEVLGVIGSGSYGVVAAAKDKVEDGS